MTSRQLQLLHLEKGTKRGSLSFADDSPAGKSERKQVAAVCYRIWQDSLEFLLVRTRKGRWTFPKGGIKRGLTQVESAALEAFEEAGVHGRIEECSFASYMLHKKFGVETGSRVKVLAYLCEVSHLGPAQEDNREPSWFGLEAGRRQLQSGRSSAQGMEFLRVIERAIARIKRITRSDRRVPDPLRRVHFEASEIAEAQARMGRLALLRKVTRRRNGLVVTGFSEPQPSKVVRLLPRPPNFPS
jgi:8-oxo-dGTP pyrophosphatase MutT (NUDIX family)